MSLKRAVDGSTTITPEFNLSECFKLAQNFPHLKSSSIFLTTIVSASRYTTARIYNQDNHTVNPGTYIPI
jgi:hypothetical protein